MATTLNIATHLLQRAPVQRVYLRARWNSPWVLQPHLHCTSLRGAIAPSVPQAEFHWLYGPVQQTTDTAPQLYPPLEVLGWFVKTELEITLPDGAVATQRSYGVIWEEDRERRGQCLFGGALVQSGQQHLVAYGLDFLYRRQRVDRSVIEKLTGEQVTIRRGLTFNDRNLVDRNRGNRSTGMGGDGHYLFAENLTTASFWSTNNIINYLHRVFRPLGTNDFDLMDWQLDAAYMTLVPSDDKPVLDAHERTLGDLFDELLNRRRGLGWSVYVHDAGGGEHPFIRPISLAATPVDMPDGWTLEPARNQYLLYTDEAVQQLSPVIKRSLSAQYDQVRVIGERIRSVFTVSKADNTLEEDWTAGQAGDYNTAASAQGDYPADTDKREAANDRVRRRQDLARVYACWKLPDAFTLVRDGIGGVTTPWLPDENGNDPEPMYRPEFRLLPFLPVVEHDVAGEKKQFLRPLVLVRVEEDTEDRYMPIDQLGQLARVEELGDGNGFKWSAHVRMSEHDAGFWIHTSGKPQHVLAANDTFDFEPLADGSDDRELPELDWRTDLIATVCAEAQRSAEAVWPANHLIADVDSVRRLVIDVGEAGRVDYVATGTVIGLEEDGKLRHQTAGGYLRDDRQKMQTIAKQAYVWYQRIRQAVTIPFGGFFPYLSPGDYLVELGIAADAEPVEAVVSSIEHDLLTGRTTIQTDYAELDFRRVI